MGSLSALGGGLIGYVVPFLFVLTIVVFFHELGHFLMARLCGIKVLVFSIGFGPEIAGFNDRYGTRWKISAVPLGGYVKFFGDDVGCRSERQFHVPAGALARSGGRRRSCSEFRAGDRHFCRHFHDGRQADHECAGRHGATGQRGGSCRL
jgi:regulator of sigma E protease